MAKLQKATLDPTKISGRCGRLKCCLRYEYDTYEEYQKDLPPIGSEVVTSTGRARILNQEVLARQVLVQTEDGRRILIEASEVLTVLDRGSGKRPSRGQRDGAEGDEKTDNNETRERPRGGRRGDQRRERPADDKPPPNS
jgi:hypothetical protein